MVWPQAAVRLTHARALLEVADLVSDVDDELANDNVAAALAGIAAADAACCVTMGQRSRGQDHRPASQLLSQVGRDGQRLGRALKRLLDIKDGAHYGAVYVGAKEAKEDQLLGFPPFSSPPGQRQCKWCPEVKRPAAGERDQPTHTAVHARLSNHWTCLMNRH
jgi:hypothetical protein